MLQFAFCIAHCHRSVTSGASGDHQPLFSSNLTSNPCLYSFQMGMGTVKVQHFIIVFLPIAFLQTLIIPTSSPFLFCYAPTRNPLCPCRRNAPGSKGDTSAISLLSLINLSSYPHFGAALSARQPPPPACQ